MNRIDKRRAIVTGGAGFIGSYVADRLVEERYEVVVVDDLSTGTRENVSAGVQLVEADITDADFVKALFDNVQPVVCCHLAAQASVTVSVREPRRDLEINVAGTYAVVEAASRAGAPVILASTGGALYGERARVPTPEDTPPEPLAPYGASKLAAEAYVATWGRLHSVPNVVLRLGNVYGPRQSPNGEAGVVAIFSDRIHRGLQPIVYGDGRQTRDYIHAADVANAFLLMAEIGVAGTFNVGSGRGRSVLELLATMNAAAGLDIEPAFSPLRQGELLRSALDASKLRSFGWTPRIGFAEGIAQTFASHAIA